MSQDLDNYLGAYNGESVYDFDNEIMLTSYAKRIVDLTKGANSILELGLGHGFTTQVFSRHFKRHLVLDGSSGVIEGYRDRFPFSETDIQEVFFEAFDTTEKFDVVVLGFVLEHVDRPQELLVRFRKFVKTDGKMFVSVPNAEVLNRRLGHLANLLPDMQQLSENDRLLGHQRFYTMDSFVDEIRQAGLTVERLEGIYLKPFTTRQILSLDLSKEITNALCVIAIDYPELSCGMLAEVSNT